MELSINEMETLTKDGINYFYCEKEIPSSFGKEFVQFVLEQKNLSPVLPVFSTLRNSFVDVDSLIDIEKVIAEDTKYKEIIDAYFHNLHNTPRMQAKGILLRDFQ